MLRQGCRGALCAALWAGLPAALLLPSAAGPQGSQTEVLSMNATTGLSLSPVTSSYLYKQGGVFP